MLEGLTQILAVNGYLPHGYCISWSTPLLSTFVTSDLLISLSYFSMPLALIYFGYRRKDFPNRGMLWLFASFIVACGTTHLMDVVVLWLPLYQLSALLKVVTALVSIMTAIVLWPMLVRALDLPSPAQLRRANEDLQNEIFERKRVEKALRLVTDGNTLLVHAVSEQILLDDICRLIVAEGGYRMAWVGLAEQDAEKTVRPVAQFGDDVGYLSHLPLSWGDTPLGRGPTGTAIRTGRTQVNQNVLTNPNLEPWREAATRCDYQSSLALPLISQGQTLGALTIYATDPDVFGCQEVKLLEELARNFAYGIETLRARAMKLEADKELENHRSNLELLIAQRTAELTAAKYEAESANQAKSRFLAAASHDLRQPLAALSLYVGALENKLTSTDAPLMGGMTDCVASLSEMLSDFLDISKLDAGVVVPNVSDFPVDAILTKIVSSHAPEAKAKGLALRLVCSGRIGRSDPVLVQRIIGNLVANAIRYTEEGGVLLGVRRRQGTMWVEVWDTGIGIPSEKTTEIFEEFKQLGNDERNGAKGSGLGLAIVAKTAALLNLQVRVRSRPGKGSVFAVELPEGATLNPIKQRHYAHRSLRIALVEDNAAVAAALVLALTDAGHRVVSSSTASELLGRLDGIPPDILVSDYRLAEGETGLDVISTLRAHFGEGLPALIVTGDTDPTIIRRMAKERVCILHKPIDFDELRARMAELTPSPVAFFEATTP